MDNNFAVIIVLYSNKIDLHQKKQRGNTLFFQ